MRGRMMLGVVAGLLLLMAATRGADASTVTAGIGLNLRACPSLDCAIYTVMPYGDWVDVVSGPDANGWYQVSYGGTVGYAYGAYLTDGSVEPQWAQGSEPSAPAPAPSAPSDSGGGVSSITGGAYSGTVIDAIYYWAGVYGVSADWLLRVAACESGYDPNAVGPNGEIGVFQFQSSTFYAYGGSNPWDPWDNARVAALMFSQGLSYHWVCQ